MIPGANLLNMAFSLIARQSVTYLKYVSRAVNAVGQDVSVYAPAVTLSGSLQPVPKRLYQTYGLDLQKEYVTFYASADILDVNRDVSGDQITYVGRKYAVVSANDWFSQDGWVGVLCVATGA